MCRATLTSPLQYSPLLFSAVHLHSFAPFSRNIHLRRARPRGRKRQPELADLYQQAVQPPMRRFLEVETKHRPAGSSISTDGEEIKEESLVARHIENVVRDFIEAVNKRDFDLNSDALSFFSSDFLNDPAGSAFQFCEQFNLRTSKTMTLDDLMEFHRRISGECPMYKTTITDIATTNYKQRAGFAQVLVNATTAGIPDGILRTHMSLFNFRKVDEQWLCVRLRSLPGLGSSGPY